MDSTRLILALVASLLTATALAAQQGEKWEITTRMSMEGFAMPASTSTACTAPGGEDEKFIPAQDDCDVTQVKTTGSKTSFRMVCKGDEPMSGTGEFERSGPDAYKGRVKLAGQDEDGESFSMDLQFSGRKTGSCPYVSAKAAIAKHMAQADAITSNICEQGAQGLNYSMFYGNPGAGMPADLAQCKDKKALLCNRITTISAEMRQPAGFSKHAGDNYRQSAKHCGQNPQLVADAAFRSAIASRNFNFVAKHFGEFEVEARKFAAPRCGGRDLTALKKMDYWPVCYRAQQGKR